MRSAEFIQKIQEKSTNVWPAKKNYFFNGWIIRLNRGTTYRANSVLPLNYWGNNIEDDITKVEKIYHQFDQPSKFQLHDSCYPSSLEMKLKNRNYEIVMPTAVMGSSLSDLDKITGKNDITIKSTPVREFFWFNTLESLSPTRTPTKMVIIGEIMDRIQVPQKRFFYANSEEKIIGVMFAVVDSKYLCVMNLAVNPKYRRLGVASSIVDASLKWGLEVGAKNIFLQVEHDNKPAIELYTKLGLKHCYDYRYYELKT